MRELASNELGLVSGGTVPETRMPVVTVTGTRSPAQPWELTGQSLSEYLGLGESTDLLQNIQYGGGTGSGYWAPGPEMNQWLDEWYSSFNDTYKVTALTNGWFDLDGDGERSVWFTLENGNEVFEPALLAGQERIFMNTPSENSPDYDTQHWIESFRPEPYVGV